MVSKIHKFKIIIKKMRKKTSVVSSKLPNSNLKLDKRRENKHFLLYYKNINTIFRKTKEIIKIIDSPTNKYRITKVKK